MITHHLEHSNGSIIYDATSNQVCNAITDLAVFDEYLILHRGDDGFFQACGMMDGGLVVEEWVYKAKMISQLVLTADDREKACELAREYFLANELNDE